MRRRVEKYVRSESYTVLLLGMKIRMPGTTNYTITRNAKVTDGIRAHRMELMGHDVLRNGTELPIQMSLSFLELWQLELWHPRQFCRFFILMKCLHQSGAEVF